MEIGDTPMEIGAVQTPIAARKCVLERRRRRLASLRWPLERRRSAFPSANGDGRGANGESRDTDEHFRPAMGIGEPPIGMGGAPMARRRSALASGERPTGRPGAVTLDWEGRVFPGNAGVLAGF